MKKKRIGETSQLSSAREAEMKWRYGSVDSCQLFVEK
jgi:hypothetical protein